MRLADFTSRGFDGFGELDEVEIEDVAFFSAMINRIIEDTLIVTYVSARYAGNASIGRLEALSSLNLIETGGLNEYPPFVRIVDDRPVLAPAPVEAVVSPSIIQEFARMPLEIEDVATNLLARFVNFHLINMLNAAGREAMEEGLSSNERVQVGT